LLAAIAALLRKAATRAFRPGFVGRNPLNRPLFDLGPRFALTLDEQWKHPDLAAYPNAVPV
jgi:hypothetical protein